MRSSEANKAFGTVMEKRGINRKSAVKFLSRQAKISKRGTKGTDPVPGAAVADVKMAAANDKPDLARALRVPVSLVLAIAETRSSAPI